MPAATFTFTENVPNGLSVSLTDADTPFGFPRDIAAFETGGTVETERVYLPGRRDPIYQVQQARERDLAVKGHLRDHLATTTDLTHARDQVEAIEAIRRRANQLSISWSDQRWTGLLVETKFGVEGDHDVTYELTFAVSAVTSVPAEPTPTAVPQANADVTAAILADLAARRAEFAALAVRATVLTTVSNITTALDNAAAAVSDASAAVSAVDAAPAAAIQQAAQRASSLCGLAQVKALVVAGLVATTRARDVAPDGDPSLSTAYVQAQYRTAVSCGQAVDSLRDVRADLRSRTQATTRVYVVRPGDTLESIARAQLGDASRAGELGVRADQLTPGARVRIPEAA